MRRARLAGLALGAALLLGGAVDRSPAQAAPAAAAPSSQPSTGGGSKPAAPARWGDGRATTDPAERPARGAPYNWRQMGFGVIIMALMLAFVVWLVRRETRKR